MDLARRLVGRMTEDLLTAAREAGVLLLSPPWPRSGMRSPRGCGGRAWASFCNRSPRQGSSRHRDALVPALVRATRGRAYRERARSLGARIRDEDSAAPVLAALERLGG